MNNNAKRFNVIGTIGNGSELRPVPRVDPIYSFHFYDANENESHIRYNVDPGFTREGFKVKIKPILREFA